MRKIEILCLLCISLDNCCFLTFPSSRSTVYIRNVIGSIFPSSGHDERHCVPWFWAGRANAAFHILCALLHFSPTTLLTWITAAICARAACACFSKLNTDVISAVQSLSDAIRHVTFARLITYFPHMFRTFCKQKPHVILSNVCFLHHTLIQLWTLLC